MVFSDRVLICKAVQKKGSVNVGAVNLDMYVCIWTKS